MFSLDFISSIVSWYKINFNFLLKEPKKIINCREGNKINMIKEFYKRLIVPFYVPILMLVPYLIILTSKERADYNRTKLFTFLIGVTIIIFSEAMIRFISNSIIENLFIFLMPFILFIFFYLFFFYKLNLRSFSK